MALRYFIKKPITNQDLAKEIDQKLSKDFEIISRVWVIGRITTLLLHVFFRFEEIILFMLNNVSDPYCKPPHRCFSTNLNYGISRLKSS